MEAQNTHLKIEQEVRRLVFQTNQPLDSEEGMVNKEGTAFEVTRNSLLSHKRKARNWLKKCMG